MTFLASIIIAVVTGVAGFAIFPLINLEYADPRMMFAATLVAGVLIGSISRSIKSGTRRASDSNGNNDNQRETIYVGNLAFKANNHDIKNLFSQYGDVYSVRLMTDRETRRSRGYGFVEMDQKQAMSAINALNGDEFMGRSLKVNIANERKMTS